MPFKIEITAADASEFAQQIVSLALTIAPRMRDALSERTTTPRAEPVEAETVEPARKPRSRPRKSETIEGEKSDVHAAGEHSDADAGGAAGACEAAAGDDGEVGDATVDEAPAKADDGVTLAEAKDVYDDLRKWIINEYINALFTSQPERTAKFRALCDHFGVAKLGELPVARVDDVKAHVQALIDEAAKK